ncbi:MAG TPA: PilN domain-containing protein [Rhodocyclaceae bacterium]|nr:PilN domain-containing protein [Rhodocyclaceae bacterium]
MIRINLLPHREQKRRERRKQFYVMSGLMVALGASIAYLGHTYLGGFVAQQDQRNGFLKAEIAKLDEEISEIRRLREQIDALLARKQVIESLQGDRAETVHLLNELARRMPEGVHLRSVRQAGSRVTLTGYAQSNARVSHLMRDLDASPFLGQPGLVEVKAATVDNRRLSEFTLQISIERPGEDDEVRGGAL